LIGKPLILESAQLCCFSCFAIPDAPLRSMNSIGRNAARVSGALHSKKQPLFALKSSQPTTTLTVESEAVPSISSASLRVGGCDEKDALSVSPDQCKHIFVCPAH
jgi:hypothetical protein